MDTILHQIVVLYRLMVVSPVPHQDLIFYLAVQELMQLPIVISIMITINACSLVVLLTLKNQLMLVNISIQDFLSVDN